VPIWTLVGAAMGGGLGVVVAHAGAGRGRRRQAAAAPSEALLTQRAPSDPPVPLTTSTTDTRSSL
jgi:hypothetical protein